MAAEIPKKEPWQIQDFFTRCDELLEAILKTLQAQVPAVAVPDWPAKLISAMKEIKTEIIKLKPGVVAELPLPISKVPDPTVFPGGFYVGAVGDVDWHTLVHWEVGFVWAKRFGNLHQIGLTCNAADFINTEFRLRIERPSVKQTMFTNFTINAPFAQFFPDNVLERETNVYLECRSPAGVALTGVWAELSGTEWS
ncbi:hypothetical protein ES703_94713 [subsurface metagenome]